MRPAVPGLWRNRWNRCRQARSGIGSCHASRIHCGDRTRSTPSGDPRGTGPEDLPLAELAALISLAKVLVTNNTGPLHVAVALSTKVIGIYCPTCEIKRWGPYGTGHTVIRPPVDHCNECPGQKCPEYDCMEKIPVEEVLAKVLETNKTGNS